MTTKLAAFFRFTFLYSAMTSIFLLLTLGAVSCIDMSCTPLAKVDLDFGVSLGLGLVDTAAALATCVSS
jgi:hypothetical protein